MIDRNDFEVVSPTKVRHKASRAEFSTYNYPNPGDAASTVIVNPRAAGEGDHPTLDELLPVAVAILRGQRQDAAE